MASSAAKIANNTILLWGRMLVITIINLYALRILINALGDDDYGLYNAVAGIVTILLSVCTVLSISTQRFYSYESGRENESRLNEIFSKSLNLNMVLALAIILLLETIGLWYLGHRLVVPDGRLEAVRWVYQFAVFSLVCMLLQIPYMAAVMAHEDMGIYTMITTAECLLKLVVILLIGRGGIDRMVFYGGGMFAVVFLTFLSYALVAGHRYVECRYRIQKDRTLYKDLLTFSGWTFYGTVAGVVLIQGNTLLLNRFFMPFINAAFAVAVQIQNAFVQLCNSVVLAIRPAMIRSYAVQDFDGLNLLFSFSNKTLFFIVFVVGIPLIVEMPLIMDVWLVETTPEKILFARLMIGYVAVMAMQNPITIIIQASGNIRLYHLLADSILILCLPVSWALFRWGMPAHMILITMIAVCVSAHIARVYCLKRNYKYFPLRSYILQFVLPYVLFAAITLFASVAAHGASDNGFVSFLLVVCVSVVLLGGLVYFFGLTSQEKAYIGALIIKFIKRNR
ncbi:MAG: polysaccharide biosynthesis protein [Bacteroidaceae bacterium]|nr:polysaccharide biosynthesis protein [Bacteroidaceae bacterium]